MAGEIINLKRVRKAKARSEKERAAEINRAKFGRSKAERGQVEANAEIDSRRLAGHRRDDRPRPPGSRDPDPEA